MRRAMDRREDDIVGLHLLICASVVWLVQPLPHNLQAWKSFHCFNKVFSRCTKLSDPPQILAS